MSCKQHQDVEVYGLYGQRGCMDCVTPTTEERDLNVKETPSTAKSKRGRPKEITRVVTKSSQSGLREGLTRATFIIREDTLDKLKERAYTDRKKLKDLVTEALDYYLEHNKSEELDKILLLYSETIAEKYGARVGTVKFSREQAKQAIQSLITQQTQEAYKKGYIDGGIGVING